MSKPEQEALKQLRVQYAEDKDDLRSWEKDANDAVKELKQRGIEMGRVTKTVTSKQTSTTISKPRRVTTIKIPFNQSRRGYMTSITRWLSPTLSQEEMRSAEAKLGATNSIEQMKRIYDYYRHLALNRAPSTQAMTSEQIEQEVLGDPREEAVLKIQKFVKSVKGKHKVLLKPPKSVSIKHQPMPLDELAPELDVVEGDLLKNGELYQPKVSGVSAPAYMYDGKLVKPIPQEIADDLAVKRNVQNVVLLDPNRYTRKPYIIHSRFGQK